MMRTNIFKRIFAGAACAMSVLSSTAAAQEATGSITANGKSAALKHAVAYETDSKTEKGFMDVVIVLSDRKLTPSDARDHDRLEAMARRGGVAGLVVRIDPDAKVMAPRRCTLRSRPSCSPLRSSAGSRPRSTRSAWRAGSGPKERRASSASSGTTT